MYINKRTKSFDNPINIKNIISLCFVLPFLLYPYVFELSELQLEYTLNHL